MGEVDVEGEREGFGRESEVRKVGMEGWSEEQGLGCLCLVAEYTSVWRILEPHFIGPGTLLGSQSNWDQRISSPSHCACFPGALCVGQDRISFWTSWNSFPIPFPRHSSSGQSEHRGVHLYQPQLSVVSKENLAPWVSRCQYCYKLFLIDPGQNWETSLEEQTTSPNPCLKPDWALRILRAGQLSLVPCPFFLTIVNWIWSILEPWDSSAIKF